MLVVREIPGREKGERIGRVDEGGEERENRQRM